MNKALERVYDDKWEAFPKDGKYMHKDDVRDLVDLMLKISRPAPDTLDKKEATAQVDAWIESATNHTFADNVKEGNPFLLEKLREWLINELTSNSGRAR
jgi:hypothetical protein